MYVGLRIEIGESETHSIFFSLMTPNSELGCQQPRNFNDSRQTEAAPTLVVLLTKDQKKGHSNKTED